MSPDFLFQAEDIFLRAFSPEDVPALHAYLNHPSLAGRRYLPHGFPSELPLSQDQVEELPGKWGQEEKAFHLAICLRPEGDLIGHTGCYWGWDPHCPRIDMVIDPEYQRQGYGSQVFDLLLKYLFENTAAYNVSTWAADWNQSGRTFAERHGFKEAGRMRRSGYREGKYFDVVFLDILRPEWEPRGGGGNGA